MNKNGKNQHAKTSEQRMREIRECIGTGEKSLAEIAEHIGMHRSTASLYLRELHAGGELNRREEREGRVLKVFYRHATTSLCIDENSKNGAKIVIRAARSREADTPQPFPALAHLFGMAA